MDRSPVHAEMFGCTLDRAGTRAQQQDDEIPHPARRRLRGVARARLEHRAREPGSGAGEGNRTHGPALHHPTNQ